MVYNQKGIRRAMRDVIRAASHDQSQPILCGVKISAIETVESSYLRLVAADGFILSLLDIPIHDAEPDFYRDGIFDARKFMKALSHGKPNTVEIVRADDGILVDGMLVPEIEGNYPGYMTIWPQDFTTTIVVNAEELRRELLLLERFEPRENQAIIRVVGDSLVPIVNPQWAREERGHACAAQVSDRYSILPKFVFGVNLQRFATVLAGMGEAKISLRRGFEFNASRVSNPISIVGENASQRRLIMPMYITGGTEHYLSV